jgi:hypothetical protein
MLLAGLPLDCDSTSPDMADMDMRTPLDFLLTRRSVPVRML